MLPRRRDHLPPDGGPGSLAHSEAFQEETAIQAIHASVDFLLEALAEDLNAPIPSKEPAFLYVANDRVCLVRSLVERLGAARDFLATVEEHYGRSHSTNDS